MKITVLAQYFRGMFIFLYILCPIYTIKVWPKIESDAKFRKIIKLDSRSFTKICLVLGIEPLTGLLIL